MIMTWTPCKAVLEDPVIQVEVVGPYLVQLDAQSTEIAADKAEASVDAPKRLRESLRLRGRALRPVLIALSSRLTQGSPSCINTISLTSLCRSAFRRIPGAGGPPPVRRIERRRVQAAGLQKRHIRQLHAYMLRIAIPYGELSSRQLRMLGHIAETYDKGYGHFTTRQNIQFNWPKLAIF